MLTTSLTACIIENSKLNIWRRGQSCFIIWHLTPHFPCQHGFIHFLSRSLPSSSQNWFLKKITTWCIIIKNFFSLNVKHHFRQIICSILIFFFCFYTFLYFHILCSRIFFPFLHVQWSETRSSKPPESNPYTTIFNGFDVWILCILKKKTGYEAASRKTLRKQKMVIIPWTFT